MYEDVHIASYNEICIFIYTREGSWVERTTFFHLLVTSCILTVPDTTIFARRVSFGTRLVRIYQPIGLLRIFLCQFSILHCPWHSCDAFPRYLCVSREISVIRGHDPLVGQTLQRQNAPRIIGVLETPRRNKRGSSLPENRDEDRGYNRARGA